jgi:DNA-directed RNA polymerase specialized sigma24 family protein
MSASRELSPDWVLSSFILPNGTSRVEIMELADAARRLWPGVQAHARKEQPGKSSDEAIALATEVWEGVLQSVAKTLLRSNGRRAQIESLDAYLFGVFHHRFNRALKKDRRRREILRSLPSNGDLGRLRQAHDSEAQRALVQSIQVQEAVGRMDEWTRKVWAARQYGYSWREIAGHFDLTEPQAKLRFRYAIGKLRAVFSRDR